MARGRPACRDGGYGHMEQLGSGGPSCRQPLALGPEQQRSSPASSALGFRTAAPPPDPARLSVAPPKSPLNAGVGRGPPSHPARPRPAGCTLGL